MPRPRAADLGVLHNHLRVVVIRLVLQQLLHGIHQLVTAREHPVDAIARMIPQREPHHRARAVVLAKGVIVERLVGLARLAQELDFLRIEEPFDDNKAIAVVSGDLFRGEFSGVHKGGGLGVIGNVVGKRLEWPADAKITGRPDSASMRGFCAPATLLLLKNYFRPPPFFPLRFPRGRSRCELRMRKAFQQSPIPCCRRQ